MTFDDFWRVFPRRVAKKDAERAWKKLSAAEQAKALEALPNHVRMWNDRGDLQYVPYPASWLNGARYEDEIEAPQHKVTAWWTTEAATLAYGASKGLTAKPGEDMASYRARLRAA